MPSGPDPLEIAVAAFRTPGALSLDAFQAYPADDGLLIVLLEWWIVFESAMSRVSSSIVTCDVVVLPL